ncbi:sodium:proton antiporter [Microbacterium sp. ZXX196]|uniref:cation:proton antiporter n=1 Tax=Microbacterium sp. ZXX196 TaxID=2609291 RepID=UPI0012B6F31C|nr:sodium:proton antiporter [Microbacterium sp. ZXX196]MTE24265.1 sodium:proton antiporter [Microbacterium sp. ZXX196]
MMAELFVVLVCASAVASFAKWRGWPAPLLVTGVALAASLLPIVPDLTLDGDVLLALVLPPLLYSASLDASFLSFRQAAPHVRRLGVGLVAVTAAAVGLVAWLMMPELGIAGALLLGAIVGPPDAVSAAAIGRKLGLPRRVMTVISGESLINDATSLTLVRVFAAIVAGATVTLWDGLGGFALAVVVGVAVGLVAGTGLHALRMHVDDPVVTGSVGLLLPFGVYAIAEHLGGSGVLAVVAMGLFVGYQAPRAPYATRMQDGPVWASMDFLLEAFVFAYIGLQLPTVIAEVGSSHGSTTVLLALAVLGTVLVVRPLFVFGAYAWGQWLQGARLVRWKHAVEAFQRDPRSRGAKPVRAARAKAQRRGGASASALVQNRILEPRLSWQDRAVISWAGMRGVVTLAMALALPELTDGGMPSGQVEVLVTVAFAVTVGTLLLQGLTLPALIRGLGVSSEDERASDERAITRVRRLSNAAGIEYLRRRQQSWLDAHGSDGDAIFKKYSRMLLRLEKESDRAERQRDLVEDEAALARRGAIGRELTALSKGWLEVRRRVLLEECRAGRLSEEVMRELLRAVDAEELALDARGSARGDDARAG